MTKVKNIGRAARILSGFNFEDASYCDISFYFATENGGVCGDSVNSYDEERFREWGKKEWRERILDSVRWYTEESLLKLTHVVSVSISFHTKDQDEILDPLYTIEMTDLSSGFFNRLLIHNNYNYFLGDVDCTIKESSRIRGARDVAKLTRKIPRVRINKIPTSLPRVCLGARNLI